MEEFTFEYNGATYTVSVGTDDTVEIYQGRTRVALGTYADGLIHDCASSVPEGLLEAAEAAIG